MSCPWVRTASGGGDHVRARPGRVERPVRIERGGAGRGPLAVHLLGAGLPGRGRADARAGRAVGQRGQRLPGVGDDAGGAEPVGVARIDVDAREPHRGVGEQRVGGGGEVGQPRPDGQHQVGLARQGVGRGGSFQPDAADLPPGLLLHGALAGEGLEHRDADAPGQALQLGRGAGVDDAAARDDQRPVRGGQHGQDGVDLVAVGLRPPDGPVPLGEEPGRPVVGMGLDVLRQREHDGAGVHRVGEHPHGRGQRGEQLLGPGDAVEEAADRAERVVDGHVRLQRVLQLLQHRALVPGRVGVAGQQQHRQPVDGGQRRPGDHVQRARSDRGGHGQGGVAPAVLGERGGRVHQGLLVAALDEGHRVAELVQGLAEPGHVAVAEDAQGGGDQPAALAVGDRVLPGQVGHDGLGDGQPPGVRCGGHHRLLCSSGLGLPGWAAVLTTAGRAG